MRRAQPLLPQVSSSPTVYGVLIVCLLCAVAVVPLLRGQTPCTHDGGLHYFRVAAMRHALDQGIIFTRWLPDLAFGYGFPFFNYRAPLSYYSTLALHVVGLPLPWALNLLYVASILGSALGTYLLGRDLFGPCPGILAGVAYAYAPYQLLDALVRGNAPEAVALALLPFILWTFRRLSLEGDRRWFFASVASLAALYLGHNISSLLFTPFLLAYLALLWRVFRGRGHWKWVVIALLAALGLTAFFWLPALAEKGYVQLYLTSATRSNDFHHNFLSLSQVLAPPEARDTSLINPPMEIRLGLVQAVLAGAGFGLGLILLWRRARASTSPGRHDPKDGGAQDLESRQGTERWASLLFFAASTALFVFMSTTSSVWLWEHVPLLPFVQFPWRFVGRASLTVALLAGAVLLPLRVRASSGTDCVSFAERRVLPPLLSLLVGGVILAAFPSTYPPRGYCPMKADPTVRDVHQYERNTGLVGVDPVGAYFPIWVEQRPQQSSLEDQYGASSSSGRPSPERFDATALPPGAEVLDADYGPNRARLVLESPKAFQARYLTFYFPGWRVKVDGRRVPISPTDPEGLMTFKVPPGRHTIQVRFGETPLRLVADVFSMASLLAVLLCALRWPKLARTAL